MQDRTGDHHIKLDSLRRNTHNWQKEKMDNIFDLTLGETGKKQKKKEEKFPFTLNPSIV